MMNQIITPNPDIACTPGWCLMYVRETYRVAAKYPTATSGWEASMRKHHDQNFPENTWVPIWFSLSNNPDGHVALRSPDGSVWSASHPIRTNPVHHNSIQDTISYYGGRLTYLGWTEDIEDQLVVSDGTGTYGNIDLNGIGYLDTKAPQGQSVTLTLPDHLK